MATNQSNGQDAGTNTGNSVTETSPDYVFDGTSAAIVVPVGDALLNSEYSRSGPDLFLETPDGQVILITNYFAQDIPPDLFTLAGSRITADVAAKLAGPRAPGQVAQDGDLSTLEEPIGTVETAKGVITVIRADGTQVTLAEGDPLYQGDTLVSGPDSAIGIIFADKSTMSMAANARIILDELVYDPQDTASNSQVFNVIQGAFMFTSGAIGKSDPEDVSVNTPVATIGIRGTKFGVSVDALDGSTNVTIFEGAVFVQNGAGNVLLTGIGETTLIPSYSLPPSDPERLPLEEIQRLYGDAIGFHPVRQEIPDDHASADDDDLQDIAGDLDDIDTAAGGNQQGGEGANGEFGEIGNLGLGGSGLGGTPLGTGGEGDGEGGPFTSGGGSSTGGGEEGEGDGEGGSPFGGETVETLEIGEGVLGDDDIIRFSSPPLSSGTNYTVSAPLGSGTQQLGLDASGLGGDAGASLSLQSGSAPDSVYPAKQSTVLSSTDGMNLTINGFEELAITLGSGSDTVEIGDLSSTSIDPDTVTIFAGDGADIIRTTDAITGTKLVVDAGDGDDFVIGSELNDEISGGAGNDTIQGGAGDDSVSGGTGNDILVGATGNDILEGNEDDDQLFGFGGDDTLLGGSGDDLLEGGSGSDVVDGGEGDDRAIFIVGQEQTEGVNDAYDGGANTELGGDTIVISFDTEVLDNPVFRQAILDIYAMLGNAASGSPEEFDTAPFQTLGLDIQNFESVELDGPSFALLLENGLTVAEDGSVLLNLAVTEVLPGKSVSVSIGDLNGASLVDNEGNPVGTDNGDGTFTLTVEQLDGLTLKPAADSDVDLNLSVTVTTVDEFGNEESIGDNLDVSVTGVADEPTLAVSDSAGIEDSTIALNIDAALTDLDGSETLTVTITGVPAGATLSAGTALGDGAFVLTAEELDGLTITPALDSTLDFTLGVSATATEADGDTATTSNFDIAVSVTGTPQVATLVTTDTSGLEGDEAIGLTISVTDIEANDVVDSIIITGVPDDASLSAGEKNEDGSYTLTLADLEGLTITPPQDSNEDIELTVAVTTKDIDSGETETATDTLTVALTGVADQASLTVSAASGAEDTAIALTISTELTDTDGSEEITEIRISNIPNGAILSAGTLDEETGDVILTEAELAGLTITPPVNLSGDFALSVSVTTQENDGDTATKTEDLTVSIAGVADAPELTVAEALGLEDQAIDLDISAALTDASETLSDVTISGLNGATLNAGTVNEDGSVTLTAAELDGLQITPAANFSGDLTLSVSVTSTDGESEATTTKDLTVSIAGVADAPELTVVETLGLEDQAIDLDISAALTDASETLSDVTISGLNGATLNAGTVNEDGSVTLTAEELDGLQITPAANFSGDLTLSVSVTSTDGESEATTTKDLTVSITGVADAPVLTVAEALGLEDQAIDLDISAALTDASETLSDVTISGLNGATLNAGTVNEDGSVTLTAAELDGLQITPAANFSGDLTLSVSVTSTDGESEATTTKDLTVSIAGVADTPELTVVEALGLEDQAIDLDISAALTDASETLSDITISGLNGATLNAGTVNEDGSVTLTAAELDGLQITPAANFSGDLTLSVSVTSTDGESEATTTKDLTVSIAGVADAPELTVVEALGLEDQAIDLDISAALTDASETLSDVTISGLNGATLNAGTVNEDGSVTLTAAELDGLQITPAANFSGDLTLSVSVTSTDGESEATTTKDLTVSIAGVADAPVLTVAEALGLEDQAIDLDISATLTDDSETLSGVTISGLNGATLNAGTVNEDGSVTLTTEELAGLQITPAANFSGDLTLSVSVTSTDGESEATTTKDLTVSITGVADAPVLTVAEALGLEDQAIDLDISAALTDDGETLSDITISGLNGATLNAGTVNEDGSVTLTAAELDGLQITPAANFSGDLTLSVSVTSTDGESEATTTKDLTVSIAGVADAPVLTVAEALGLEDQAIDLDISAALTDASETLSDVTISGLNGATLNAGTVNEDGSVTLTAEELAGLQITPAANFSGDLTLSVSVTSTDGESEATTTKDLTVSIAGVADAPVLTVAEALGLEDQAIDLDISAALTDDSETLSDVTISGLNGATLNAGTVNEDGSVTLTAAELDGLQITPAANFSGDLTLSVSVTSTDGESEATTTKDLTVSITGVADAPVLTVAEALGLEDQAIDLDISAALTDASETLSDITISGLNGATLNAGTVNEDGSVTLTAAELDGLQITPAANFSGDLTLGVSVTSTDGESEATTTKDLTVSIAGVADAPELTVAEALGLEDQAIDLDISAALTDASETLSDITISGLNGATLNAGTVNEDGSVTLTAAELDGLQITPAANFSGDLTLSVSVTSTDGESEATTTKDLTVSIAGVADAPVLTVAEALGLEDQAIDLDISAALTDDSETLSDVTISGLNGATLNAGTVNEDGSVTLTAAELDGLQITPAANFSGDLTLSVSVTSTDGESDATTTKDLTVSVTGVADAPVLTVAEALGLEDQAIDLDISAALTDASETLSDVTISGLNGATLNAGTVNEDGSVTLTAEELAGLQITPAANFSGDLTLSVSVTSTDGESEATTTKDLTVSVTGVADAPVLTADDVATGEDTSIELNIGAFLTDASEDLSEVTISNFPPGTTFSAGVVSEGVLTISAGELAGLTMTPPDNFSGDIDLTASVSSQDGEGSETTTTTNFTVTVEGIADAPELTVGDVTGDENTAIALNLSAALTDTDGSETLTVEITGLPAGATLSAGTVDRETGAVTLTTAELEDLTLIPAPGSIEDFTLSVTATATEDNGDTATTVGSINITVEGIAGEATLVLSDAEGIEDVDIPLTINVTGVQENDTAQVTISNIPIGASLSSGTIINGVAILTIAQLANLTITPPANSNEDFDLTVTVTTTDNESGEERSVSDVVTVGVTGDADAPVLTVGNAIGTANSAIALNIESSLQDLDGSESLTLTITGLPEGATLVNATGNPVGTEVSDGVFSVPDSQLGNLFVLPPEGSTETITLTVTATATENDGDTESVSKVLTVDITGTAGEAVVTVTDAAGLEDTAIPLAISVGEIEADDTATITLSGIPTGAVLKDGNGTIIVSVNGSATLSQADLAGLTITPPPNSDTDFELTVTVVTEDNASGQQATVNETLVVTVAPDADAPLLDVANVTGSEDSDIPLSLSAALGDLDGSEILTGITITGLPEGATLSAGAVQPDGSVLLTVADLQGLTIRPPANFSGDIQLAISATALDGIIDSSEASASFTVTVSGVADTPTLELNDTAGNLAAQIPVDISGTLTDLDGSEELTVTISGLNGAILSAGTLNDDGTVTLSADELTGLTITPVPNTSGSIELTVTATATEADGDTASISGTVTIAVADSSTVVLIPGQDLDLVAPESGNPSDTQKLVLDAGFGGATTGDDWIIAQDDFGRVTLTNTLTGQLVTADGYEEIDIDFGPGEDTVELRDLSNTDLGNNTLTLNLGDGNDTVTAGEDVNRNVEIYGGAGNDDLQGSNGADLIDGGADDDILSGGAGDDDLDGGEGSDKYLWSEGDGVDAYGDTGTEGIDTIVAQTTRFEGIADGFNAGQSGIEAIGRDSDGDGNVDTGSPLLIALSDSSETVDFSGLDFLNSQTTVDLGDGNDTVTTAVGDGDAVTYTGGEGQDTLNLLLTAESLNQMISAGQLALLQSYIASPDNAVLTLTTPNIVAQGFETVRIGILGEDGSVADVTDALSNAISDNIGLGQIILGTNEPDLIFAGDGNDIVRSFDGEDVLFGGAGEDYLNAGADDDYVDGGTGNDIIDGGSGNDRLLGGEGADLVSGGQGDDDISGGAGNDFLAGFQGDDTIKGDAGDDFLAGGSGQDSLYGGEGNDRLVGGSGDDFLIGGSGIDSLDGESGNDVLIADDFEDQLFGGTGDDLLISTMDELPTSRVSDGAQGNFAGVRDGGEGVDTFRLDSDEFGPHTLSGDQFSNIRNIETLDLSGVDQLQLSLRVEDIVTMTDEDNDLTILLGENVSSVEIDEETIQLENGQAIFEQDGVHIVLQQQQPPPEAS